MPRLLSTLFMFIASLPSFAEADSPWPMFRHDPLHTGRTTYAGPDEPAILWKFSARDGIVSSPAIGSDGTVYFGAGWDFRGVKDHTLYALKPDGSLKWSFDAGSGIFSSPAIAPDGTIYFGTLGSEIVALADRGAFPEVLWRKTLGDFWLYSSPVIAPDGSIYIGGIDYNIYALNPDGSRKWNYPTRSCVFSSPALDDEGIIRIGSKDQHLYALEDAGGKASVLWKHPIGGYYDGHMVDSSPAVAPDGTAYFGVDPFGSSTDGPVDITESFFAVNPDGSRKWSIEAGNGIESSPALGADGVVYTGSHDGNLYAIRDDSERGHVLWKFKTGDMIDGSPIVDGNGVIYVGSRDGFLYAVNPDGSLKWKLKLDSGTECSPAIDDRGVLYIGTFGGTFYAIGKIEENR